MKKFFICLIFFCSLTFLSFASSWYYIGNTINGMQVYIDNSSVIKNTTYAEVWIKYILPNGNIVISRNYILRNPRISKTMAAVMYDSNGNYLTGITYTPTNSVTLPVVPDSVLDGIYNSIW